MGDHPSETGGDSAEWYYAQGGAQLGPVSFDDLVAAAQSGRFGPGDLVWREGMADWQPASTVPELFDQDAPRDNAADAYEMAPSAHPVLPPPPAPPPGSYAQPAGAPLPYGQPLGYAQPPPASGSHMGMAIGGFVCTLVALPILCCVSFLSVPLSLTGLILGVVAKRGMDRSGNAQGRGLAIAAIVIGIVEIVLCVAMVIVYIVVSAAQQRP